MSRPHFTVSRFSFLIRNLLAHFAPFVASRSRDMLNEMGVISYRFLGASARESLTLL